MILRGHDKWKIPFFWPYILLFVFAFVFFLGCFYLKASLLNKISSLERLAAQKGIVLEGKELSFLPPELRIKSVRASLMGKELTASNVSITPALFPLSAQLKANCLGGSAQGEVFLDSLFHPVFSGIDFSLEKISAANLADLFDGLKPYLVVEGGDLSAKGDLRGQGWGRLAGTVEIKLNDGRVNQKTPVLKKQLVAGIMGEAKLEIRNNVCQARQCVIRAGDLSLELNGSLTDWANPARASLNVDTVLRVPPGELEERLVPQKTMALIKKNGAVVAHISQKLLNPRIQVEN